MAYIHMTLDTNTKPTENVFIVIDNVLSLIVVGRRRGGMGRHMHVI